MTNPNDSKNTSVEQRVAALERQLAELVAINQQQAGDLARLNLWHQGHLFSYIARLYPKNRSVIFLHSDLFGDNVKYAFLAMRKLAGKYGVSCHFLINNASQRAIMADAGLPVLPALNEWTLDHIRAVMGAKVLVACDHFTPQSWSPPLPYFLLQGSRLVQLWHGIPFKEIGLIRGDAPGGALNNLQLSSTGPADLFVAPGSSMHDEWREWFAFREFSPAGYPRNDVLLRDATGEELINVDLFALNGLKAAQEAQRKTIMYAPTFRDHMGNKWIDMRELGLFAQWCEMKGYFLFVKLHWAEREGFDEIKRRMPDVRFARPDSDIYPLLRHADVLVTDYSSVALDYLLLDRPIVFYWPDHDQYRASCRNLLPGFEHYLAGEQAMNLAALQDALEDAFNGGPGPWADKRHALAKRLFDFRDDGSGDRVTRLILGQLESPEQLPEGWGL